MKPPARRFAHAPRATVIPAKAGIQDCELRVDPGVYRDDIQGVGQSLQAAVHD